MGDLDIGSDSAQRNGLREGSFLVLGQDGGHRRLDVSGSDGVHGDRPAGQLAGKRFRQADQPGFRGGVVRLSGLPRLADDRCDVDDPSPSALHHLRHHGLRHQKCAGQVRREDVVPILALHPQGQDVPRDSGVVDEDVDRAEVCDHRLGALFDRVFTRDVQRKGMGSPTRSGDLAATSPSLSRLRAASATDAPATGQFQRTCAPNSLRSSCNQCDTTCENAHEPP